METPVRTWPRVLALVASLCAVPGAIAYLHLALGAERFEGLRFMVVGFAIEPTLVALLAAIAIVVWATVASRRWVSPVVPLGAAVLPWIVGSAMSVVSAAAMSAPPPSSLSSISAFYGVVGARLVGTSASAALLGCVAVAAAWNAHAPVAERASPAARARGLGLGLVLCGALISVAAIVVYPRSPTSLAVLLSATGLSWALIIGHSARATGEARPRIATLVVTATGAGALQAWTAMPLVGQSAALSMYAALGHVAPDGRDAALATSVDELTVRLAGVAAVAVTTTLAAAAFGVWTSRAIPEARRALWIAAAVLAVCVGIDVATTLVARAVIVSFEPQLAEFVVP